MNVANIVDCYGCGVCASACPQNAITISLNTKGFYNPFVNGNCVNCGICFDVCAYNKKAIAKHKKTEFYAGVAWSRNSEIRQICTSGGVCYEIANHLINQGYKAIVCKYNNIEKRAEHYIAETEIDLKKSIGSKYIQSYTVTAFSQIKKDEGYVIIGTPCQIDSIRLWLRKRKIERNSYLIDFFCHGVPSMLMWQKYLQEVLHGLNHDTILWRDKERGWHNSYVIKIPQSYSSWSTEGDLFYKMFLGNRCLNNACYLQCKYKRTQSAADLRIGDMWSKAYSNNELGVNAVVAFTPKGKELLNELKATLCMVESDLNNVCDCQMNSCAHRPISYYYVMRQLTQGTSLARINKIADLMDSFENVPRTLVYYIRRIPSKVLEIIKR